MPTLGVNKQAKRDYEVLDTFEAGIVLSGQEVKSIKLSQINLKGSYVSIDPRMEAWLVNAHISAYKPAASTTTAYNPTRKRKLILHKKELKTLFGKSQEAGLTILPISVYTKGNLVKVEIALGRGKKKWDKRETIKKREIEKDIRRRMKKK